MRQQLTQNQTQRLTPQQVQAVRLLELSIDDLEQRIHEELESNFVLEEGALHTEQNDEERRDEPEGDVQETDGEEQNSDEYVPEEDDAPYEGNQAVDSEDYDYDYDNGYLPENNRTTDDEYAPLSNFRADTSFREDLKAQLSLRHITDEERYLAEYILESLDESGYLTRSLEALRDDLAFTQNHETTIEALEGALDIVQDLEPAGIGARNLRECLLLQLADRTGTEATQLAYLLLDKAFDDFSNKRYERLMNRFHISADQLAEARRVILSLSPKPAMLSAEHDAGLTRAAQATPDFIVTNDDGTLILHVNNAHIPPIRISPEYDKMLETLRREPHPGKDDKQGISLIRERMISAHAFIDALNQRRQTMTEVMKVILVLQRDFFLTGDREQLHPMVLNDVASRCGYDISTVSRVSNGKYVQTDFGIFPLKQLFTEGVQTDGGETVSNAAVQALLARFIQAEDKSAPLTDDKLAEMLKEAGYPIARRTVAKYREQLGYNTARLRREVASGCAR